MQVSQAMRAMIEEWEGLRLHAYHDIVSVLTIGYGHTGPDVHEGQTITQAQADGLLEADLHRFEEAVESMARSPTQAQFDALVSFAYNLGAHALAHSTLLRKHNAGNFAGAADEFLRWDHAGGRQWAALTRRRQAERECYLHGTGHVPPPLPPPDSTAIAEVLGVLHNQVVPALQRIEAHMTAMDDQITALQADVQAENTVIDSAVTLIEGFSQQLADAVAAAQAAGATPAQLQSLTDLDAAIKAKSAALSQAVTSGVAPPPPPPTP